MTGGTAHSPSNDRGDVDRADEARGGQGGHGLRAGTAARPYGGGCRGLNTPTYIYTGWENMGRAVASTGQKEARQIPA